MYKWITGVILTVFLFGVIGPNVSYAMQDESELDFEQYVVDYHEGLEEFDARIYYDNAELGLIESEHSKDPGFQVMALPLAPIIIAVVVRLVGQWVEKQAVKKISKHAAERAGQRGITERQFASAMAYGTKYVDKNTGAKILYHSPTKTTLVLDKAGKVVVTTYKQNSPKAVWKKQSW